MRRLITFLISVYQCTLSPDHGWFRHGHPYGHCRFSPSCSQYAKEAVERKGVARGLGFTIWRVLRCNPWNRGGFDPVK